MLDFHTIAPNDADVVRKYFKALNSPSCEYCFGTLCSFGSILSVDIAQHKNCLIIRYSSGEYSSYAFPVGENRENVELSLYEIVADAKKSGKKCNVYGMTEENAKQFKAIFGDEYTVEAQRNAFEYIYNTDDLINLKGKKFQPKRNHISFFKKSFTWSYERISRANIPECIKMSENWLEKSLAENKEELEDELRLIKYVFKNYEQLGFVGGLIRKDGEVIAYTLGEKAGSDTFCVHFEKAYADIRGAYAMINQQFCENELSDFKYVNREDDVGIENLRKAKLSYRPAFLLEKYEAVIV